MNNYTIDVRIHDVAALHKSTLTATYAHCRFVMVNVENGVETSNNYDKYRPDGKYVPRILFFTPGGELIRDAFNRSSSADSEYRYFHKSPYSIVQTMNYVLKNYSTE